MGFLYFVPGEVGGKVQNAVVANLLSGVQSVVASPNGGPNRATGLLTTAEDGSGVACRYLPETQSWLEVAGSGYWVGMDCQNRPTAKQLLRSQVIDGEILTIDGQEWLVPILPAKLNNFPKVAQFVDGKLGFTTEDRWLSLVEEGAAWSKKIEGGASWNDSDYFDLFAKVMAVNYRVTIYECAMLRIIRSDGWVEFLRAVLGWAAVDRFMEDQKKTDGQTSAGFVGSPG